MRKFLLLTASLAVFSASSTFAADAEDAAYNKSDRPIYDSQGDCVRTKWMAGLDPCAPAVAPKKKPPVIVKSEPAPVLASITREQLTIYFDFNSAKLTSEATGKLDQIADIINKSSQITEVKIHGFTDQIGTNSYNDALANKRAATVKKYLDAKSRLKSNEGDIRGLGKSETDGHCMTIKKRTEKIACMATQRRVEVEFVAQE